MFHEEDSLEERHVSQTITRSSKKSSVPWNYSLSQLWNSPFGHKEAAEQREAIGNNLSGCPVTEELFLESVGKKKIFDPENKESQLGINLFFF